MSGKRELASNSWGVEWPEEAIHVKLYRPADVVSMEHYASEISDHLKKILHIKELTKKKPTLIWFVGMPTVCVFFFVQNLVWLWQGILEQWFACGPY